MPRHNMRNHGLAVALIGLLSGCMMPPRETPRQTVIGDDSIGLVGMPAGVADEKWWHGFADPQLDRLIELALDHNPTLQQAQARLREALAQADAAHAGLLPKANLDASLLRQHAPQNYLIPPPLAGEASWMGQAGVSLGWDLDFWGRQADAVAGARSLAQAAHLDIDDTRLALAGAVAQAYVNLYRSYAMADIAGQSEQQRQHIIDITHRRVTAGLDTRLELREAEGQLPQARVDHEQARASIDLAVHQLAVIAGQGAASYASITRPSLDVDATLPVPLELPINLLARRPDVLAAALQIRAADSERLAARAAFYPDVSLRAIAGFGAFGLDNLFSWSARGYGGGPLVSLPLFDGGRLRANYRGSEAQLDAAIATYDATVLQAVRQTADQLTRIDSLTRERIDQQQALTAAEDAYRLAEKRYRAGLANYLTVLTAETQVLTARRVMVDITADQVLARVMLLIAVGGSFDPRSSSLPDIARSTP
jgi:NodT family efflux transporter outer membrane factor (OMF) lipoprotein